jgi:hypothetical protein
MPAKLHAIVGRASESELVYPERTDFTLGSPIIVPARRVLDEPGWSPYCIDATAHELVFVRLPPAIDLSRVAFWHVTQAAEARELLTVPLDEVPALAAALPAPTTTVLIFSMGRCGTTLLSHALNGSPLVFSISEPGVFSHRPLRRLAASGALDGLISNLVKLCFATRTRADQSVLAIKFLSQTLFIAPLCRAALPDAKNLFMYRDAIGWGNSFVQFLSDIGVPYPPTEEGRAFHWMMNSADRPLSDLGRFADLDERPIRIETMIAPGWVIHMEEYQRQLAAGMPFLSVRYNELISDPQATLERI